MSNSSFIDGRTYDGFRELVAKDFHEIWIIDLKGNARTSGERRRREGGNIFHDKIRVGIAIYFCIKKKDAEGCRLFYQAVRDYAKASEKLDFLILQQLSEQNFEIIKPNAAFTWINQANTDFASLLPVVSAKAGVKEGSIFQLYSNGVVSARDEWAYGNVGEPRPHAIGHAYACSRQEIDHRLLTSRKTWNAISQSRRGTPAHTINGPESATPYCERYDAVACERFSDLLRPFFLRSFNRKTVLEIILVSLEDR